MAHSEEAIIRILKQAENGMAIADLNDDFRSIS